MIPAAYITDWERRAPWPTREQIEQDLALSRLIVELANDGYLGEELVFRGGTCLHKLYLPTPLRYSEDLDYVRTTAGGVGPIIDAVRQIGDSLGMRVDTRVTTHPKIRLRAPFETGTGTMSIKVEINTFERSPARPPQRIPYSIDSPWFNGGSDVLTFDLAELVATKIRALYQRSKGRDLSTCGSPSSRSLRQRPTSSTPSRPTAPTATREHSASRTSDASSTARPSAPTSTSC